MRPRGILRLRHVLAVATAASVVLASPAWADDDKSHGHGNGDDKQQTRQVKTESQHPVTPALTRKDDGPGRLDEDKHEDKQEDKDTDEQSRNASRPAPQVAPPQISVPQVAPQVVVPQLVVPQAVIPQPQPQVAGVTVTSNQQAHLPTLQSPATYGSCSASSDVLTFSDIRPNEMLVGQIIEDFVVPPTSANPRGRSLIQQYPISFNGTQGTATTFTISYPNVAQWPSGEIHVDIQAAVIDSQTQRFLGVIGPGRDFDVFCNDRAAETLPVVTTNGTRGICPDAPFQDPITFSGILPNQQLRGQVVLQSIVPVSAANPTGRIALQTIPVSLLGSQLSGTNDSFSVPITIPALAQWGSNELHVEIQVEVVDTVTGQLVGTIGPGKDFDVFCTNQPAAGLPLLTAPGTRGLCPTSNLQDVIQFSSIGSTEQLQGQIVVQHVVPASSADPSGRIIVQTYPVSFSGSSGSTLSIPITIPPSAQWPTTEVHVEIQVQVFDSRSGQLLGTLGPRQDYDVFCQS